MKFPYGMSDFFSIITEEYYYADRTHYIETMETLGKHLLFLRPRRFGKSLWLHTLRNYYDAARKNDFEKLFGHLKIGKKPTGNQNRYFTLVWDFSCVETEGTAEQIKKSLFSHINSMIHFFSKY